jgi:uncharacterized protein YbjT (DUF2867 family)
MRIIVAGATGYVGGRLVGRLVEAGHEVTVVVRNPDGLDRHAWQDRVTVESGDLLDPESLPPESLRGFEAGYYLVHSLGSGEDFDERDRKAAETFSRAADDLPHLIYLGGLLPDGHRSAHLQSRARTGEQLSSLLPVTEFRAGPIIGSGSASFEMVRYLTERLPVMVAPKWIRNEVQPIGVRDLLAYLMAVLDQPPLGIVEIGGEVLSFRDMLSGYARVQGLPRAILPLPVLAPRLAARWVSWITPIRREIAQPLVEGIVSPVTADLRRARELFPDIDPADYATTLRRADERQRRDLVETRWAHAVRHQPLDYYSVVDQEGLFREVRRVFAKAPPEAVFRVFSSLGGDRGYLVWNWAWHVRGWIDLAFGGPGMRRGRRDPQELDVGDHLDFWRVESIEPNQRLVLRAEMRNPGLGWLSWEIEEQEGGSCLTQTALFRPKGLGGFLYWYFLYIPHRFIFSGMANSIARQAEEEARAETATA